jgi:hypothetical protein
MSENTALIRKCVRCGMVTAVDLENTPENAEALELTGQVVEAVTEECAIEAWKHGGRCECAKRDKRYFEYIQRRIVEKWNLFGPPKVDDENIRMLNLDFEKARCTTTRDVDTAIDRLLGVAAQALRMVEAFEREAEERRKA